MTRKVKYNTSSKKGREKDPRSYRAVNLTSVSEKIMEKLFLEATTRHKKDKEVFQNTQRIFMEEKLYITDLIAFSNNKIRKEEQSAKTS